MSEAISRDCSSMLLRLSYCWHTTSLFALLDNLSRSGAYRLLSRCIEDRFDRCTETPLVERKGTIEVYIPLMQGRLIPSPCNWFKAYITPEYGTIHDWYIVEYDTATNCICLLRRKQKTVIVVFLQNGSKRIALKRVFAVQVVVGRLSTTWRFENVCVVENISCSPFKYRTFDEHIVMLPILAVSLPDKMH